MFNYTLTISDGTVVVVNATINGLPEALRVTELLHGVFSEPRYRVELKHCNGTILADWRQLISSAREMMRPR